MQFHLVPKSFLNGGAEMKMPGSPDEIRLVAILRSLKETQDEVASILKMGKQRVVDIENWLKTAPLGDVEGLFASHRLKKVVDEKLSNTAGILGIELVQAARLTPEDILEHYGRGYAPKPPAKEGERHFKDLSITAAMLASNLESCLRKFDTVFDSSGSPVGDVVYGGWLDVIDGVPDALSVEMAKVDRFLASDLLFHLKSEKDGFPELADTNDWSQLTGDKISYGFIERLRFKANGGDFTGKCNESPS